MSAISEQPIRSVDDRKRWWQTVGRETWASLAIAVMWLSVALAAIAGPDIVNRSAGGDSSTVPSAVAVALFAFLGTWVVARYGLRERRD